MKQPGKKKVLTLQVLSPNYRLEHRFLDKIF